METFLIVLGRIQPKEQLVSICSLVVLRMVRLNSINGKGLCQEDLSITSPDNLSRTIDNPLFRNRKNDALLPFHAVGGIGVMLNYRERH